MPGLRHVTIGGREEVEVGYGLRAEFWGQGLATELASASVRVAFEILGLPELVSFTLPTNRASRRVMEKVGMSVVESIPTPEDMQGVDGAERGGLRYEITREQWERR